MTALVLAAGGAFDWLRPAGDALRFPFQHMLSFLTDVFQTVPLARTIGAYGLAIIVVTVAVKLLLFPLFQTQLRLSKRTQAEQRKIAPELADIRKRYRKDPQRLNKEMMALYKQHGINPLSPMLGCLPSLAQFPVLIGLYQAIFQSHNFLPHGSNTLFLGLDLVSRAQLSHPGPAWILPLLAAATTYVQTKMFAQPPPANPDPDDQAAQMARMSSSMSLIMPFFILYISFQQFALLGLVLYWTVSNIFAIFQQYTVNGWGQLPILGNKQPLDVPPPRDRGGRRGGRKQLASAAAGNGRRGRRR